MFTRLEYIDSAFNHYKFWEAELPDDSATLITRWGRIDTAGSSKSFSFASHPKALQEFHKKVAGKLAKGYRVTVFPSPPQPPPLSYTTEKVPEETPEETAQQRGHQGHRSLSQWMSL